MQQDLRAVSRGRDERNLDTLPGPEQICGMAHRSGKSWEEHSRALFVFCETGAKFLTEKQFFTAGLDVKGEPCDRHREQRADFSEGNGGTEKREQNARVDRMTDGAVGPGSNQFMALFERDHTTPIRAEMPTRPKRHSNAVGCQGNAKPRADRSGGKKRGAQPAIRRMWFIEEVKAQPQRKRVCKTLKDGLALFRFLSLERRCQPIRAKEKPQRINPLAGRGEMHISQNAAAAKTEQADRALPARNLESLERLSPELWMKRCGFPVRTRRKREVALRHSQASRSGGQTDLYPQDFIPSYSEVNTRLTRA